MERVSERLRKSFARFLLLLTSLRPTRDTASKSVTRFVAVLAMYLFASSAAHAWWDLTWDERAILTFDNSLQNEDLDNFPVLIVLDPSNIDYSKIEPNGEDLRFVDADDTTLLDHEIELWNPGGTSYIWVRVPRIDGLSSSDFIYLYHDKTGAPDVQNASGVWSAGYLAVWHLDDDPSVSVLDSTINTKHGTGSAPMNAGNLVGGRIGQATTFDGSTDYIRVPSGAGDVLEINGENLTMESWVRRNGSTAGNVWMSFVGRQLGTGSAPDAYVQTLDLNDPSIATFASSPGNASSPTGSVPNLTWRYLAATKDASFITHYVSGSQTGQNPSGGPIVSDPNDVTIGGMENGATPAITEWFVGDLDEIRISNVTRSADWIAAQHLSMTQNFVTFDNCPGGVVTTTVDSTGGGSLRACVIWANNNPGADTITLPADTYNLTLGNVGEDLAAEGDLDILEDLTITGAGARTTIIDGWSNDRIFDVYDTVVFSISDVTLRNGDALTDGADGGAMDNHSASITITDVTISGNSAKNGGALGSSGGSSSYTLQRVTLSGNTAEKASAIINSSGGDTTTMTNVTITGNTATIENGAGDIDDADFVNVTIVGNTAPAGKIGGIRESGGGFTAINTIIANNIGGDCNSAATSSLNSIDSDGSCGLNTTADPKLGALANNGGPTDTMMPQSDSPAIEGGTNTFCPAVDQRSIARPEGALCDVGAVEAALFELTGTIFVDEAGDGLTDGPIGVAPNLWEAGARIELYRAGPDGNPDGVDDTYLGFTTSSAVDGTYSFSGLTADTYYVTVDSQGVDDGPYNGTYSGLDTWAEQTYGPIGAASFDGVSTWTFAPTAGASYGGAQWDVSDDHSPANSLPGAEHIARVDTTGGDVGNVDFGFSFNVVTTTRGGSAGQDPGAGAGQRTVQGSLRQFLTNANAQDRPNVMRFVPAAPTNASGSGGNWWRINNTGKLPVLEYDDTTIDGTAYCAWSDGTQGCAAITAVREPNAGTLGYTGPVGTGPDGVVGTADEPILAALDRPELEIQGVSTIADGLEVRGNDIVIRRVSIWGFGSGGLDTNIFVGDQFVDLNNTGTVIEFNVIGTPPDAFTDPGALRSPNPGIYVRTADDGIIRNNRVGYLGREIIRISTTALNWQVLDNELRSGGMDGAFGGVTMLADATGTVSRNLIIDSVAGDGVSAINTIVTVEDNTISGNGDNGVDFWNNPGGFTAAGSVERNSITGNGLRGVRVRGAGGTSVESGPVRISLNHFNGNTENAIDLMPDATTGGITVNSGVPPACGTEAGAGNTGIDTPVITGATVTTVSGLACAGARVEVYLAVAGAGDTLASVDYGEGDTYLGFVNADGVTGIWSLGSLALTVGDEVSAIAIDGSNNTSEFAPNVTAGNIISGTVFEDVNYGGGIGRDLATAAADAPSFTVGRGGVTVELYNAAGNFVTSTVTAAGGGYSFTVTPGTYTVRVVNGSVTSSRPGSDGSELAVQTYRIDGVSEAAGDGAKKVGGELPSNENAAANSGAQTLASLQGTDLDSDTITEWTQSIVTVDASGGDVSGVDFGFNFDVVVNTNDSGQGSLRQFIINSNLLAWSGRGQERRIAAVDSLDRW